MDLPFVSICGLTISGLIILSVFGYLIIEYFTTDWEDLD